MTEVQDIFRKHGDQFLQNHKLSYMQTKAFRAISSCRTAEQGAHIDTCDECGFEKISYNSCRNRHCPKCQTLAKEQWIEKQSHYLLDIGYFHAVFTLPDELNPILYQNQEVTYSLFFKAVSETLLELCHDKKYLGAKIGITAVLHTWGQNLNYHPHIHCIIPGGGLTAGGKWIPSRKKFFLPMRVLSRKFRGKFLFYLKQENLFFCNDITDLSAPHVFDSFISALYRKEWVTYCKPPFQSASKVVSYLGRYTHRVAISNHRILELKNGYVSFKWRDYRDSGKNKILKITAFEFIRRFMMHVLPRGFMKVRHYGILASRDKRKRIAMCRKLTDTKFLPIHHETVVDLLIDTFGQDYALCPCCRKGHLSRAAPVIEIA